ncbi:hypothetical protein [Halococcus qingdaonensis]|uniref:hypothetical protein n=1 Tax=Halococcus qingdaonensis TaxID=224402 RepID=UPI0021168E4A|nr:hypothetical protein [Halococcus qingdaonensis]
MDQYMKRTATRRWKIVIICCSLFLMSVALTPLAHTFDISVYAGMPLPTLVLFGILICIAVTALSASIIITDYQRGLWGGLAVAAVAYAGFFHFSLARGYVLTTGFGLDTLVHLGYISDILSSGEIHNFQYPATYLLFAEGSLLTGLPSRILMWTVAWAFFMLFILSTIIFVQIVTGDSQLTAATGLASLAPIFGAYRVSIMPWLFAYSFLFIALAALERYSTTNSGRWLFCLLLVSTGLAVFHPYTSVIAGITILGYAVLKRQSNISGFDRNPTLATIISFILLVGIPIIFKTVNSYIRGAIGNLLITETGGGATIAQQALITDYSLIHLITRFILQKWGVLLLYFGVAGVAVLYLLHKAFRGNTNFYEKYVSSQYIIGGLISILLLFVRIFAANIIRVSQYLIMFSVLAVAIAILKVSQRIRTLTSTRVAVAMLLIMSTPVIGLDLGTTYQPNDHISEKTATGYNWHLDTKNMNKQTALRGDRDKLANYFYGHARTVNALKQGNYIRSTLSLPRMLGYNEYTSISKAIGANNSIYLVTRTADRRWYHAEPKWRYKDLNYYTADELQRLKNDNTANRIYFNGGLSVWVVAAPSTNTSGSGS